MTLQGRVRFGSLDRESQKAITNLCRKRTAGGTCDMEMLAFLRCLKRVDYDTDSCPAEVTALQKCAETSSAAKVRVGWTA